MRLINFLRDKFRTSKTRNDSKIQTNNELIHPRFEATKEDGLKPNKVSNSLLFLMYSKENENLFV